MGVFLFQLWHKWARGSGCLLTETWWRWSAAWSTPFLPFILVCVTPQVGMPSSSGCPCPTCRPALQILYSWQVCPNQIVQFKSVQTYKITTACPLDTSLAVLITAFLPHYSCHFVLLFKMCLNLWGFHKLLSEVFFKTWRIKRTLCVTFGLTCDVASLLTQSHWWVEYLEPLWTLLLAIVRHTREVWGLRNHSSSSPHLREERW